MIKLKKGRLRKSTEKAAGYDLFATEDVIIYPGGRVAVKTGVVTEFDSNIAGLIRDRSGLAINSGITKLAGLIDGDYPNEWAVVLLNTSHHPLIIKPGDRIAQVVFVNVLEITDVEEGATLEVADTQRTGGFGSTGV